MMLNAVTVQHGKTAGFTLVELMIALVLGLLVIAGVGSVFLANQNAYRTNVALGEAQESARISFEFLARDIRSAGANPCGTANVESVLNSGGDAMLYTTTALEGWDEATEVTFPSNDPDEGPVSVLPDSGAGAPVEGGGGAVRLSSSVDSGLSLEATTGPRANVKLQSSTTMFSTGAILMMCDVDKGTVFQVTNYNSNNTTVVHNQGGGTPGNLTKCLDHPVPQSPSGDCTTFSPSSYLAIPTNYLWYVGENSAGGRSLYRYGRGLESTSGVAEMVRGVWQMEALYHEQGDDSYVAASAVGNWDNVDAVRLELTVRSGGTLPGTAAGAGTDGQPLERVFTSTIAMRNQLNNN